MLAATAITASAGRASCAVEFSIAFKLIQDDQTILFKDKDHKRLDHLEPGNSGVQRDRDLPHARRYGFRSGEDPFASSCWRSDPLGRPKKRLRLLADVPDACAIPENDGGRSHAAPRLPQRAAATSVSQEGRSELAAPADQLWAKIWRSRVPDVAILGFALSHFSLSFSSSRIGL